MTDRRDEIKTTVELIASKMEQAEAIDLSKPEGRALSDQLRKECVAAGVVLLVGALCDLATIASSLKTIADDLGPETLINMPETSMGKA